MDALLSSQLKMRRLRITQKLLGSQWLNLLILKILKNLIRTYLFGCHEHIKGLKTFTVNITVPHERLDEELMRQKAKEAALVLANKEHLPEPLLLSENGLPDLQIVIESGQVTEVYCRNSVYPPSLGITDLDYSHEPEEDAAVLQQNLVEAGYTLIPFILEDAGSMDKA